MTILVHKKFSILGSPVYACFEKSVILVKVSLYRRPQKNQKITNIDFTLLRSVSDLDRGQPKPTFFTKNVPNNDISVKAISPQHTVFVFVRVTKMAQSKHVSIFLYFHFFDVLRKIHQNNNFGISLRNLTHKY